MAESEKPEINREITIPDHGITVEDLAEKLAVRRNIVLKKLLDAGIFATPDQVLDARLASKVAKAFRTPVRIESD
jgi:translation initiation factor IF-2